LEILLNELVQAGIYADQIMQWDMSLLLPSAQLHDVGKIVISDMILNKPGKLTAEEFTLIKNHCAEGERIIDEIIYKTHDDGFLRHARIFAGSHHERWDGSGYPRGLKGEEIPLEGRLMAIADVYDALVSERPYKKAMEIIQSGRGTQFDPDLVDLFICLSEEIKKILEE
jgi:putative two-component system response regulator